MSRAGLAKSYLDHPVGGFTIIRADSGTVQSSLGDRGDPSRFTARAVCGGRRVRSHEATSEASAPKTPVSAQIAMAPLTRQATEISGGQVLPLLHEEGAGAV